MEISDVPQIDELRYRLITHLHRSSHSVEAVHLWGGYLAALLEWGLIGRNAYLSLSTLIGGVSEEEMYQLFGDEPMPGRNPAPTNEPG